jgi:hypothetical protein
VPGKRTDERKLLSFAVLSLSVKDPSGCTSAGVSSSGHSCDFPVDIKYFH